jgi:2-polyprenyl-3-methyl-5-hydroxy-6-metoxy-1,4-benzoquinol methylase
MGQAASIPPESAARLASMSLYYRERVTACHRLVSAAGPRKLLDIGCADGLFLSLFPSTVEKHGLDIVRRDFPAGDFEFHEHDLSRGLPFADGSFDVIHCGEVIEHLLDSEALLRECRRCLAPGGTLVVSTPNLHYWRNFVEWLLGNQFYFIDYKEGQEGHVRYFCPRTLRETAAGAGFTSIELTTVGDWAASNPLIKLAGRIFLAASRSKNMILIMAARAAS